MAGKVRQFIDYNMSFSQWLFSRILTFLLDVVLMLFLFVCFFFCFVFFPTGS